MLMKKLIAHNYFYHSYIKSCICKIHIKEKQVIQGNAIHVALTFFTVVTISIAQNSKLLKANRTLVKHGVNPKAKRNEIVSNKRS